MSERDRTRRARTPGGRRWGWKVSTALAAAAAVAAIALWTGWAEDHPREERRLRVLVHDRLEQWFPEAMDQDDGWHGLLPRSPGSGSGSLPRVLLLHGLDEPGSIWDDLIPVLAQSGFAVWELHYPNDQGIDRSAAFLAEHWPEIPAGPPLVLIGHSMGGLVAREFVSLWRHPVGQTPRVQGAEIAGVILAGTPNHGSEWARLRVWLELRDQFPAGHGRRDALFAALRDGTGEAKVDLRPGSDFLTRLNARPWPESVPMLLIGGRLVAAPERLTAGLAAASAECRSGDLRDRLERWWSGIGEGLGDGAVTLESLALPGAPRPIVVDASHRGMLRRLLPGDPQPPAIAPILAALREWGGDQ